MGVTPLRARYPALIFLETQMTKDWEFFHLTPTGWVEGACSIARKAKVAIPTDRVLTRRYTQIWKVQTSDAERVWKTTWPRKPSEQAALLLITFGDHPPSLDFASTYKEIRTSNRRRKPT